MTGGDDERQIRPVCGINAGATLGEVLRDTPLDRLDTRILLAHALSLSRVQLITQTERPLTAAEAANLSALFARRLAGEPIAYLTGEREFYGLSLQVTPDVLIPRPETELLVELSLERLPSGGRLLDMGTGSGAIAIAVAHQRPDAAVSALDVSPAALRVAQANAARHGVQVSFLESDWYTAVDGMSFEVIASNPPYIVDGDPHLSQGDLRFEPQSALTDRADGLSALRILAHGAARHLAPGGWLLMEHGYDQAEPVRALLAASGLTEVQSWRDLAGIERVSGGQRPAVRREDACLTPGRRKITNAG